MRRIGMLFIGLGLLGSVGCNAYRLKPPAGFAEVGKNASGSRMIAGDHVGLNVRVFHNVRGGTLAFWGEDMVNKLGTRNYVLQKQSPVTSKNGVPGTRFDFALQTPDGDEKFYSAVLFVSNEHRIVIQLAGDAEYAGRYHGRLGEIASATKIKGCKSVDSLCKGPQPGALSTPAPKKPKPKAKDGEPTEDQLATEDSASKEG